MIDLPVNTPPGMRACIELVVGATGATPHIVRGESFGDLLIEVPADGLWVRFSRDRGQWFIAVRVDDDPGAEWFDLFTIAVYFGEAEPGRGIGDDQLVRVVPGCLSALRGKATEAVREGLRTTRQDLARRFIRPT
jgi:hypothetical protein